MQYLLGPFSHGAGQGPVEAASLGDEVGCAETFQPQKRMMIPKVIHIFHFLSECPDRSMSYDSFFCLGFVRFSADVQVFTGSNKQVQVPLVCHMFSGHLWPPHFCPSPCSLELLCETLENLFFFHQLHVGRIDCVGFLSAYRAIIWRMVDSRTTLHSMRTSIQHQRVVHQLQSFDL